MVSEALPQRREGGRIAVPEAPPRQPHVPVRQVVHELGDRPPGEGRVVVLHPLGHPLDRGGQARADPAVEVGRGASIRSVGCELIASRRLPLVHAQVRVPDEEGVRVPERLQELAHRLADRLEREAVAVPGLLRGEVVPAEGVRSVRLENVPGHDDVALRLRHLLALGIQDQAQAETRLVRRAAEQQHGHGEQRVEPAARLVEPLADVVRREAPLELLLVVERGVPLGERHAARVPPDVDQVGHAPHLAAAVLAAQHDVVDVGAVQVVRRRAAALADVLERPRAEDVRLVVLAAPDRQRRAPVALARQRPVDVVLEPLAEAPVLDVLGVPVDRLVGGEQLLLDARSCGRTSPSWRSR